MLSTIFYTYGFLEIVFTVYILIKNKEDKYEETNPMVFFKPFNLFKLTTSLLSIIWSVIGLLTSLYAFFAIIFALKIFSVSITDSLDEKGGKLFFVINNIFKITLILLILYFHFWK